jgi:hypothetical protein
LELKPNEQEVLGGFKWNLGQANKTGGKTHWKKK